MKKKLTAIYAHVRKKLALVFFAALLIVPSVSVLGWAKDLRITDSRKVGEIARFNTRPVDMEDGAITPFQEPLISVTFDDGWESIYTTALPLLHKYGIRTTQYILSGEFDNEEYMSMAQVKAMQQSGHDIACHSINHPDLTTLDDEDLEMQLSGCKDTLSKLFGKIEDFASPYGASNDTTIEAITKFYSSQRNTNGDITDGIDEYDVNLASNFNAFNIIATTIRRDTTVTQINQLLDYASAHNAWVVLTYHQVDDGPSQYGLDAHVLEEQLKAVSEHKARIVKVNEVLKSLKTKTGEF